MLTILLLFACTPITVGVLDLDTALVDSDPVADTSPTDTPVVDTAPEPQDSDPVVTIDTDTEDTEDTGAVTIPGVGDAGTEVFTLDFVHEVEITLPDESVDGLYAEPYEFVVGDLLFDGIPLKSIGVRIKGRLGSYRTLDQKSGFKLDFNTYGIDQELYGLEKLNLNNMVQDGSCTHEVAAYAAFRAAGAPAPRVGYAWVTVNGADYGIYSVVEVYDDVFLDTNYENPDGNLYDGDYVLWPNGSYTLLDFQSSVDDLFQLDEGVDVGLADIKNVSATIAAWSGKSAFYDEMAKVVNWEEIFGMWAGEIWTGHYDSYSYNRNNFRVYFNPETGLAEMFPWDPDWAFYASTPITSPSGLVTSGCMRDDACYAAFKTFLPEAMARIDALDLVSTVDVAADLVNPYVKDDPRKEYSSRSVLGAQGELRTWIAGRTDQVERSFGL